MGIAIRSVRKICFKLKSYIKNNVIINLFQHPTRKVYYIQVCYMQIAHLYGLNILWDAEINSA